MVIPDEIRGRNYISLATFRKNGLAVHTPVWFGEEDGKLYVKTRGDSGKFKRVRSNPQVRIAPCTMRGRIVGPEFAAIARVLPVEDWPRAAKIVERKYWLARLSISNKKNVYLEIVIPNSSC
jgi:PPOX class probable F420-dependent enzyme